MSERLSIRERGFDPAMAAGAIALASLALLAAIRSGFAGVDLG